MTDFSSDHILNEYQRLNEMDFRKERYEEPEPDEDNEEDYPSIGWRENSVTVKNINGQFNCMNDGGNI